MVISAVLLRSAAFGRRPLLFDPRRDPQLQAKGGVISVFARLVIWCVNLAGSSMLMRSGTRRLRRLTDLTGTRTGACLLWIVVLQLG